MLASYVSKKVHFSNPDLLFIHVIGSVQIFFFPSDCFIQIKPEKSVNRDKNTAQDWM